MNQRRRRVKTASPNWWIPLSLILVIGCLVIIGMIAALNYIPARAEGLFGAPSGKLSATQRLTYSVQLLLSQAELNKPVDPNGKSRAFTINLGESATVVAARLQEEGLIQSADAFRNYLVYSGLDTGIQAGSYQLSPSSTAVEIAHRLMDTTPGEVMFRILPGWRIEEIAAALPTSGLSITTDEFITAARSQPDNLVIGTESIQAPSYEGFLLPGSYTFKRDATLETMLITFVGEFNQQVNADILAGFQKQKLSLLDAVILASIVQKEAVVADEQPMIASVFLNRIAAGMKLDSDPTVQYAIGYNSDQHTWWTNPLSQADLQTDSPYNTYLYAGLPPGPISNPGLSALQAVAFPAQTPYFYFRARCDGSGRHLFAQTLQEQVNNACP